jgi:hypothetical protein
MLSERKRFNYNVNTVNPNIQQSSRLSFSKNVIAQPIFDSKSIHEK